MFEYLYLCLHTIIVVYTYNYMSIYICVYIFYMSNYNNFLFLCYRLLLIKICLCCFFDVHLYSNSLSTITLISSLIISELFPACFSCSNNFNLSQSSSGSDGKKLLKFQKQ